MLGAVALGGVLMAVVRRLARRSVPEAEVPAGTTDEV